MNDFNESEFEPVEQQLRRNKPELSPIELDRVKQGVVAEGAGPRERRLSLRSRWVAAVLAIGLVGAGGGAVLAASGGSSSNGSSANSQYCPPNSPGHGKPKHHGGGNKCGHPPCPQNGSNGKGKDKCKCDKPKKHKHKHCP